MVPVVELGGRKKREVVAGLVAGGVEEGQRHPQPLDDDMGAHQGGAEEDREDVGDNMLNWMTVDRGDGWNGEN